MIRPSPRRALTIIEVTVSMLVVSAMLGASLCAVAASRAAVMTGRDRATAAALADDLLGFIYKLPYNSPSGSLLGIELGNLLADKTTLDDVDDFHGMTESPPCDALKSPLPGLTGWERSVVVEWVTLANPGVAHASETGVKRITVVVKKNGVELARRSALRTALSSESN
jgi:hypothetical protein